ncbi:2-hydroxyisoflavanone dehydratase-like [Nymphaea colorata]|nr:2-hydroxyisoflavanone dehydratase-like [Nymphaea colorata]
MDPSSQIVHDFPPFLRVYRDGRVERFRAVDFVPPGLDPGTGVTSKDVVLKPESGVSIRLYHPPLCEEEVKEGVENEEKKGLFPIIFYIHGGAFCIESAFSTYYHSYLNSLVAESRAVAVSVEYRLAPEHPVPTAYLDCWAALQWVVRQAEGGAGAEPWLKEHGDFGRLFLAGDSAGANVAHHLAMAAGGAPAFVPISAEDLPIKVSGIVLVHPFFFGRNPGNDRVWEMVCPTTPGIDDPLVNLVATGGPEISRLECRRVLVLVAGNDFLRDRGCWYEEVLTGSGWSGSVEIVEHQGENHVFHLIDRKCENAEDLMRHVVSFINRS